MGGGEGECAREKFGHGRECVIKAEPKLPVTPGLYIYRVFNVGNVSSCWSLALTLPHSQRAEVSSTDHNEQVPVLHACGESLR